jgi:hypothetical protein
MGVHPTPLEESTPVKVTKKKYRRLVHRVEDLTDAHNHLAEHQDSLQIMVQQRLGQVVQMLEELSDRALAADAVEDAPIDLVTCPICDQSIIPVSRDGQKVFPRHSRAVGVPIPDYECTGSNMPVESTDAVETLDSTAIDHLS